MYGTNADADTYHALRGNIVWAGFTEAEKTSALIVASEYLDATYAMQFPGRKTAGRDQLRQWPRMGAYDWDGESISSDEVPREVTDATYELALRQAVTPGSLSPDFDPAGVIESATVVGAVSVKFANGGMSAGGQTVFTVVEGILEPVLTGTNADHSALSGRVARV